MSIGNWKVAQAFVAGRKATGNNLFTDGKVIYSYGYHFPIAMRLNSSNFLFNSMHRSISTTRHQSHVKQAIGASMANAHECTIEEIKKAVLNPGEPVILTKYKDYNNLNDVLDVLGTVCHKQGLKIFPRQKWKDMIEDNVSISVMRDAMKSNDTMTRIFAASKLKEMHDGRMKEAINLVVKLLDDPEKRVAKRAYVSLMSNLPRMNGRVLTRVDRMLQSRTDLTCFSSPHVVYIGSINTRYKIKREKESSSVLLYRDDEEILWFEIIVGDRSSYLLKLDPENISREMILLGERDDGRIVTTTVSPKIYASMSASFKDLE